MKEKLYIILLMLGMIFLIPGICFARDYREAIVMNRVWNYHQQVKMDVNGVESNTYLIYTIKEKRRNFLLWLIPSMYSVAHGDKEYVGEAYGKMQYRSLYDYNFVRQVKSGTVPHHRKPLPPLFEMIVPNVYGEHIYRDRLLSPFHYHNRRCYIYRVIYQTDSTAMVTYKPRVNNTQLIDGEAIVNVHTGSIYTLQFKSEFDMIKYDVSAVMDAESPYGLAKSINTKAAFKFMGNNILSEFTWEFDCPETVADSINNTVDPEMMERLRPFPITSYQDSIYKSHEQKILIEQEQLASDTLSRKTRRMEDVKDFFWDVVGDHMVNSTEVGSGKATVNISPLFNPLYMSYSRSKGISYKLSALFSYKWNEHRYLTIEPGFGYATKVKQFYYTLPIIMNYNPKRYGSVGLVWGNGNRTSNAALAEIFNQRVGHDSIGLPEYRDEYFNAYNHIGIFDWIRLTTGLNYHLRVAVSNHELISRAGLHPTYRSFAPYLTVHLMPWKNKGPVLTANYERSLMKIFGSNLQYERWEFDGSYKLKMRGMRMLNLRGGSGFYTQRSTDYFVDFTNFRDQNLPTGWNDDWTGQFQLVDSRWYNESNYYIRSNISYESPLLALSWLPLVGRFIETERLYFSALGMEHTRPYFEIGYGLKCRYFSTGIFASFLNSQYNAFECKFTLELFNRW